MINPSRIFNSWRPALLLTVLTLVVSACSGSGSDTTTSVPASTTSTAADTTVTTSEPEPAEPEVILIGKTWDEVFESELTAIDSFAQVGDEIWIIGDRYNRSLVLRSADDGETWTSTAISEPVESGTVGMSRVAQGPQGRIVGIGSRGTGCDVAIDAEDGFLVVGLCSRFQPMIHISDDGGDSWTQHEPTAISSAGNVFLTDIAATQDGFMAIGTIRGADWHGAIWSSVDGATWDLTQELRSNGGQTSADRIFIDENGNVVLLTREHPCSEPFTSGGGWVLGSQWADHVRIYSGMTGEELELQSENDNPVAPAPADIDCATQDEFEIAELPYPTVTGEVLDGRITLLGSNAATASDASDVATHRVIQLTDAGWTDVASEFETALERKTLLIDVDVNPGVVITPVHFKPDTGLTTVTSEDGDWTSVESAEPLDIRNVKLAYGHNGTVIVVGTRLFDPEESQQWPGNPTIAVVFRSIPTSGA